jgi:hypothetical protein
MRNAIWDLKHMKFKVLILSNRLWIFHKVFWATGL